MDLGATANITFFNLGWQCGERNYVRSRVLKVLGLYHLITDEIHIDKTKAVFPDTTTN